MAKNGDFVTATVDISEKHQTRQGILDGNVLLCSSGAKYKVIKVHAVVKKLWGSNLEFYNKYNGK